jgi:predicted RNA binding protein YcfA (HicA-like mRNA interferase family)
MSKREKLPEKLKTSPKNAIFDQVEKVLLNEGFALERISSSHHVFKRGAVTFVIPVHRNKVKAVYVKRVAEIIEELKDENS